MRIIAKPPESIMDDYEGFAAQCRETHEPVAITRDGEDNLLIMDMEGYRRLRDMIAIEVNLQNAENDRHNGARTFSREEVMQRLKAIVESYDGPHGTVVVEWTLTDTISGNSYEGTIEMPDTCTKSQVASLARQTALDNIAVSWCIVEGRLKYDSVPVGTPVRHLPPGEEMDDQTPEE